MTGSFDEHAQRSERLRSDGDGDVTARQAVVGHVEFERAKAISECGGARYGV